MSVRTMARVWDHSTHAGTELLMLLAIADFADDEGNAYPAVPTLAAKCRMSPRNANFILSALRESGELEVRANEGPRGTNRYKVVTGMKPASPLKSASPLKPTSSTPEAGFPRPLKPTSDEPSLNHQEPPVSARAKKPARKKSGKQTFEVWYASTKVEGQRLLPDGHWIRKYCEDAQLGDEFLQLHWQWWKAKQLQDGKLQADWIKTFGNSVKGNYGHLWYRKDGIWMLTSAGKQAALVHGFDEDMNSSAAAPQGNRV